MFEQLMHVTVHTVIGWIMQIVTIAFVAITGLQFVRRRARAHAEVAPQPQWKPYDTLIRRGQIFITVGVLIFTLKGTIVDDKVIEFMGNDEFPLVTWLAFAVTLPGILYLFAGRSNRKEDRKTEASKETATDEDVKHLLHQ